MTTSGRVVGGFEHQAAMILGVNELIQYHPQTLAQIVSAIHDRMKIIGVVANADQQAKTIALLKDNNLPEDCIDFFRWPVEAMWVRDYAPYFVVGDHTTVIDYTNPEQNRDLEDSFSVAFAATFGLHYIHAHLTLEGGNLTSNGDGLCITTTKIGAGNEARGYNAEQIGQLLHDHFHFTRWVRLSPLDGEPTGHTDMFLSLCAVNRAIVGYYRPDEDPVNARILDENAAALKGEPTKDGPMEVIRIPMPSHKDCNWRTYANVIYANGVVLVPQYPDTDRDLDRVALDVFHEVLPDWKVVGIDCSKLIAKRGGAALHFPPSPLVRRAQIATSHCVNGPRQAASRRPKQVTGAAPSGTSIAALASACRRTGTSEVHLAMFILYLGMDMMILGSESAPRMD